MFSGTVVTTHLYPSFLFFGLVRSFMIVLFSYKYEFLAIVYAILIYEARDEVYVKSPNVKGVEEGSKIISTFRKSGWSNVMLPS